MDHSRSEHILNLAKELLDDIELSRVNCESLLLKSSRLARWVGSEEIKAWIGYEMHGFNTTDPTSLKYMGITGRWIDYKERKGYWGPLAQQETIIQTQQMKLKNLQTPDTSGDWGLKVMSMHQESIKSASHLIHQISAIRSKVLATLHNFISAIYYEKQFDSLSESIFEKYKSDIDTLLSTHCGSVLEQIPSVMARLAEGSTEATSQALNTTRRIIDAFADSIFPPQDTPIVIDGNEVSLGPDRHLNRINAYVNQRVTSKSRITKIRQNLANLYERVSTGVHSEIPPQMKLKRYF
ncbi:hypothetical protein ACF8EF_11745 [Pseudomonas sp. zjy_15]|uniref:AbiTii domain-containing protein n=1 Tax=Pseudomonas sp. zjy_15 TaxID=3367265 RepID=UPI00370A7629